MRTNIILKQRMKIAAVLLGLAFFTSIPYLNTYLIDGHDTIYHITRIEGIYHSLASGHRLVRINPIQSSGYGYASGILYPQLFLYFPAVLRFFDISLINCYRIFLFVINLGTAVISYFSFKKISRSTMTGLLGTALYSISIYRLTNIYSRGAIGEALAMCFFPLVLYGMYEVLAGDSSKWKWLVIGYTGILQSHILSTLLTGFFCVLAVLLSVPKLWKEKRRLINLLKAAFVTILINLWFLIPFLQYYTLDLNVKFDESEFWQTATSISQMFTNYLSAGIGMNQDIISTKGEMIQSVGLILIFVNILFVIKPKTSVKPNVSTKILNTLLCFGLISLWMSSIVFPWETISSIPWLAYFASVIQFTWRFLAYATLFLCVTGAIGLTQWITACIPDTNINHIHFAVILSLFIIVASSQPFIDSTTQMDSLDVSQVQDSSSVGLGGTDQLYLYHGDHIAKLEMRPQEFTSSENVLFSYTNYERYGCRLLVDLSIQSAPEYSYIELPLYYYPGYKAWINGNEVTPSRGNAGVIRVPISEGTWHLEVDFTESLLWRICDSISLLTGLGLAGTYAARFIPLKKYRQTKRDREK